MIKRVAIGLLSLFFLSVPPALALSPDEILDDPVLEERARALSLELRCMVCQNQSIDDSDAPLAKDLRGLVRERLVAGDSDADVISFLVDRYGEFVLLKPRFALHTLILWAAGPAVLLAGIAGLFLILRRRKPVVPGVSVTEQLSAEEQARLDALLNKNSAD